MLVARTISLCPDIRRLRSIDVQRKLHWQRTSDDEHSARGSMGVPPASGMDRHATCHRNGQVLLNAEAAHCLPVEWIGRRLTVK